MSIGNRDLRADEFPPLLVAAENVEGRNPFALVTIVAAPHHCGFKVGAKAVFDRRAIRTAGWVGGNMLDEQLSAEVLAALSDRTPRVVQIEINSRKDLVVAILIDPIVPAPIIWLAGTGTVAEAICDLAASLGFDVVVAHKMARARDYPAAIRLINEVDDLAGVTPSPDDFVLVLSDGGEWLRHLESALASEAGYVGLVGDVNVSREAAKRLQAIETFTDLASRLHAPCGIEIGASTPGEIALSVLAEIVKRRRDVNDRTTLTGGDRRPDIVRSVAMAW